MRKTKKQSELTAIRKSLSDLLKFPIYGIVTMTVDKDSGCKITKNWHYHFFQVGAQGGEIVAEMCNQSPNFSAAEVIGLGNFKEQS